jgi:chromosome segregation ATPase
MLEPQGGWLIGGTLSDLGTTRAVHRKRGSHDRLEELRERLGALEETKKTAQGELESISLHQQRLEELERDADDLVRQYADIVPESLEMITPEEKHRIYKTLRMKVLVDPEGTVAVEIVSGKATEPDTGSVKSGDICL